MAKSKHIQRKLEAEARKKHLPKRRANAYVYGTLTNIKKRNTIRKKTGKHK